MLKFGNAKTKVPKARGKGSRSELLPSRHALSTLVNGSPEERSLNNYAKLTPSGRNAVPTYAGIIALDQPEE